MPVTGQATKLFMIEKFLSTDVYLMLLASINSVIQPPKGQAACSHTGDPGISCSPVSPLHSSVNFLDKRSL